MEKIPGLEINEHQKSKRIIDIKIEDELLKKLIFPFNKFDITALEYKPFSRFTIAKSLDSLVENKLSKLINSILRNRDTGCFIIGPKNNSSKINSDFLVAGTSPKAWMFFPLIFPQFIDFSSNYVVQFFILITTYMFLDFASLIAYAMLANKLIVWLKTNPRVISSISACVLLIIAIIIAITTKY